MYKYKVSIGMPVYNGEEFIEDAIFSILNQTFRDFELIISDNCSTDKTREICERYQAMDNRVKYYLNNKNHGAAYNYNKVFRLSNGEYFKWSSHDDIIEQTFLEECVKVLDEYPSVVMCFPSGIMIDKNGKEIGIGDCNVKNLKLDVIKRPSDRFQMYLRSRGFHRVFGLIRSDALNKTALIGNYLMADRVLLGELAIQGNFYEIPECLYFRRMHPKVSTIESKSDNDRSSWMDPANRGRLLFPRWRRYFEYFRSVHHSTINPSEKFNCYLKIAYIPLLPRIWKQLIIDIFKVATFTSKY